jgi:tripartite-type tricarboxylate transporter receptor subunit TctC
VDFVARALAEHLGKELGHTVIIDNKAGANGAIGAGEVVRSVPDGSTLWFTSVGAAAINPSLYEKLAYDTQKDLAPVALGGQQRGVAGGEPANPPRTPPSSSPTARSARNRRRWRLQASAASPTSRSSSSRIRAGRT